MFSDLNRCYIIHVTASGRSKYVLQQSTDVEHLDVCVETVCGMAAWVATRDSHWRVPVGGGCGEAKNEKRNHQGVTQSSRLSSRNCAIIKQLRNRSGYRIEFENKIALTTVLPAYECVNACQ